MSFEIPQSMEECYYFTNREIGNGHVIAWVKKKVCLRCHKGLMGKPVDDKGKVKVRAKYYVCPECGYQEDKEEYEKDLEAYIIYTCPHCGYEGKIKVPFKRKKIKGVETLRFQCESCHKNIDITKKMKN